MSPLTVACEPHLARIVRMTAANVATLSAMSVERVEDMRMAAEEAFIYACGTTPGEDLVIDFDVDERHVAMTFQLSATAFAEPLRRTRPPCTPISSWARSAMSTKSTKRPLAWCST